MKKFLSILLTAAVVFTCFTEFFKGLASTDTIEIMSIEAGETSEYGYIDFKAVDSDGNVINSEKCREDFIPKSSGIKKFSLIPSSYNAAENGCITTPKNQGLSGNCWAFSTISAMETDSIIQGIDDIETADYSESHFSWFTARSLTSDENDPTYGDGCISDSPYLTGGNWLIAAASLARWNGLAEENDYPFSPNDLSAMGGYDESLRYDTGSGIIIKSAEELASADDIKQWIMNHGTVTAAMYYNDSFYNPDTCAYNSASTASINHQITIIGWDDNYSADNFNAEFAPEGNGAWLCQNSWSEYWGNKGCFWMSYYDAAITNFAGFTSRKIQEGEKNYTYNGVNYFNYFKTTSPVHTANVFTAKGCEKLTAISIYTLTESSNVTVEIYTGLKEGYTSPEQGNLALKTATYSVARKGYHTLELPKAVQLEKGMIFSIVVECEDQNGERYVPIEINGSAGNSYAGKAGESYYNMTGYENTWVDCESQGYGNVFIQAFTQPSHALKTEMSSNYCEIDRSETTYCSQCGLITNEEIISAGSHSFGEWSNYSLQESTGRMVKSRVCDDCGATESQSYYPGNQVTLQELFEIIIGRIIELLKSI